MKDRWMIGNSYIAQNSVVTVGENERGKYRIGRRVRQRVCFVLMVLFIY